MWDCTCYLSNEELQKLRQELKFNISILLKGKHNLKLFMSRKKTTKESKHNAKLTINRIDKSVKVYRTDLARISKTLTSRAKSKYDGENYKNGVLWQMFNKRKNDLTIEERREYDKFMKKNIGQRCKNE